MADAKNPFTTKHVSAAECAFCRITGVAVQLQRCRICHRRFCDDCAYRSRTGQFCSEQCARMFFHGEGEAEDDEPELDEDEG